MSLDMPDQEADAETEFVEVYATHDITQAQILEDRFEDLGVPTIKRTIEVSQFRLNVGPHGEIRIGVPHDQVRRALEIIGEAVADGALIAEQGEILVMVHQAR